MNKELQDANEELQAANEELMLTQEELQATNEEFEATNEELTFRTAELQELTRQNRLEQVQLSVLLQRFPYYVMVLDAHDLTIKTVNRGYKDLFCRPRRKWSHHHRRVHWGRCGPIGKVA